MAYKVKSKKRTKILVRVPYQTGKRTNKKIDENIKALPSGKRKTSHGTTYWETRRNRSDKDLRKQI